MILREVNDKEHPNHILVKTAVRNGLHDVTFRWYPKAHSQAGWVLTCRENEYFRFTVKQRRIIQMINEGVLTDDGEYFKITPIKS
jgi:hypothetical protein